MRTKDREEYLQKLCRELIESMFSKIQDEFNSLGRNNNFNNLGEALCFEFNFYTILSALLFNKHVESLKVNGEDFNHLKLFASYISNIERTTSLATIKHISIEEHKGKSND